MGDRSGSSRAKPIPAERFRLVVSKGRMPWYRLPVQMDADLSTTARALYFSLTPALLTKSSLTQYAEKARMHAVSGVHQTPKSNVACLLAGSSSGVDPLS